MAQFPGLAEGALKRFATHMLQFKPGRDVAMLNAMMHVIVEEGLVDQSFVEARTIGFDDLRNRRRHGVPVPVLLLVTMDPPR